VPSLWAEAFGLTVVEAMVAEVPLIDSYWRDSRIGAGGETAILIDPRNVDQLVTAPLTDP
jgi:glycosyltransferase involved in cell wall biosynthesis